MPVAEGPEGARRQRSRGRLTLVHRDLREDERTRSVASFRRRNAAPDSATVTPSRRRRSPARSSIPETITIQELANRMSERGVDVIKLLMKQGQMHKITDAIDADTAQLDRRGARPHGEARRRVRRRGGPVRRAGRRRSPRVPSAGRHHHGPCRPRQDLAARRHPQDQRRLGRGRRHHAAHRRLPGDLAARRQDHLHRHAGPRGLHGHAGPRRQGDGHRGAGRRRR